MKNIIRISLVLFIAVALLGSFLQHSTIFVLIVTYFGMGGVLLTGGYLIYESLKK